MLKKILPFVYAAAFIAIFIGGLNLVVIFIQKNTLLAFTELEFASYPLLGTATMAVNQFMIAAICCVFIFVLGLVLPLFIKNKFVSLITVCAQGLGLAGILALAILLFVETIYYEDVAWIYNHEVFNLNLQSLFFQISGYMMLGLAASIINFVKPELLQSHREQKNIV